MAKPTEAPVPVLTKILATSAVWSIVGVVAWRLRHPFVELALLGIGASLTYLIWNSKPKKED